MRSSNKSRSRNKNHNNNRRGNTANVLNRVFDSSGPEGKVRGTPQQIIDKYQSLAEDATLSGDRVNAENFLQHSEHYSRLLIEAQREINERREAHEAQRQQQPNQNQQTNQKQNQHPKVAKPAVSAGDTQPDIAGHADDLFPGQSHKPNLVDTPESKASPTADISKRPKRVRQPAVKKVEATPPQVESPAEAPKPAAEDAKPDTAAE